MNVRWFGAKGDGIANDAPAIQKAIDHFVASGATYSFSQGGTVYIPRGTYLLQDNLKVRSGIRIQGDGWASVLRGSTGCTRLMEGEPSANYTNLQGFSLVDLTLDGTNWEDGRIGLFLIPQPTQTGAYSSRNNVISGVQFHELGRGLRLVNDQGIRVSSCYFINNDYGAIISDNAQLGLFEQCDFRFNNKGLLIEATASGGLTTTPDVLYGWKFLRCHWEENWGEGVILDGAQSCNFDTCKWEKNGVTAAATHLVIQQTASGKRPDANRFDSCLWNGTVPNPTAKQVHIKHGVLNQFENCWFNSRSNAGIHIDSGVFHTRFIDSTFTTAQLTDNGGFTSRVSSNLYRLNAGDPGTGQAVILQPALRIGSDTGPRFYSGAGVPSGSDGYPVGSLYLNTSGGASTTLYVKTGASTWTAK